MVVSGGISPICEMRLAALQPASEAATRTKARWRKRVMGRLLTGGELCRSGDGNEVGAGYHGLDHAAGLGVGDADRGAAAAILERLALRAEPQGRRLEHDGDEIALADDHRQLNVTAAHRLMGAQRSARRLADELARVGDG